MIPAGKPPISLIALKFSTLFRQLQHHLWKSGETLVYQQLAHLLNTRHAPEERLAVMGDFNISPEDQDIGIGEANRKRWLREGKTSFQPIEREWLEGIKAWGLSDSYRLCHPNNSEWFSWFDYRSKGFDREPKRGLRIDYILVSKPLAECVTGAGIDYPLRGMERPSDHAPTWSDFTLTLPVTQ